MNNRTLVKSWEELNQCKSDTHYLKIDLDMGCGWVKSKTDAEDRLYLSTHSFYGSCHEGTTQILQERGFAVEIDNWDNQ
ncbi:hypothetical protein ADM98_11535 [Exiguobacterium sp. BMC-KP]|uniref:hypothetical protein n=1 Tax=Exiguobacterium sp. BMC-KP TaxID=1684312 RepID=UPI0006AA2D6B|nr:hypothetical protein [Exiguobacterium sp. BMC-KP]KOP29496.1 hypothetical protein ADM98_11535 [Exiguobacterium sp. BMC-KP]